MKESTALKHGGDANFNRNAWAFSLGGIGRDMAYTLWANFIVIAVLLTKGLDTAQFSILSVIIIVCRIFDAINDPIMGGLVEATSTKWGKFKPWILIGVVTNCVILYTTFAVPLYGNDFLIFFPFAYILWDITFTMNDIGYWSMLPSLTSNEKDRNTISTMANLTAGIGAGAIGLFLPMLTNGDFAVGGNAVTAYKILPAIICGVFLLCQIMTVCVVKEKPEHTMIIPKSERTGLKHMIGVLRHNDQLQWIATSMFFFNIGSAVLGSLISYYVYFTYGYNGVIVTIFTIISGISAGIIIIYPFLSRKFNRRQLSKICLAMIVFGYAAMLIVGLLWHDKSSVYLIAVCAAFPSIGQGIYYMVLTIGITNTVEYNEFKTGKRDEGIIFSLRPFMAKMASALLMGIIAIVFGILNVADITKAMSNIENSAALGTITSDQKATEIANIIATVPEETKQWLLVCMTVLPIIFLTIAIVIFLRKYKIDETYYGYILKEIDAKKAQNLADNSDLSPVDNCETEKLDTAENI